MSEQYRLQSLAREAISRLLHIRLGLEWPMIHKSRGGVDTTRKALMEAIGQGQSTPKQWATEHRDNITACNEMWALYIQVRTVSEMISLDTA
jgi:hypothetical protein